MIDLKKISICLVVLLLLLQPMRLLASQDTLTGVPNEDSGGEKKITAEISSPYALLMEVSTGTVLWEKAADVKVHPASVTKIMTMLLILEAVEAGKIDLEDTVTVSEYAASMGGSQVYLEANETQTVDTMLKCIAVSSANDACVAMAEQISGSEMAFVERMNQRASELGMTNTHFVNCCGLDAEEHLTTARDVALMSRELLLNHPQIHDYCTIWMENIIHNTARGSTEFGLSNTNKLLKQYEYATGLKTGYTSTAGFCVSASAEKDGIELVAVIMGGTDSRSRFQDAITLLNTGFQNVSLYRDEERPELPSLPVTGGVEEKVSLVYGDDFSYVDTEGNSLADIQKEVQLPEELEAPVEEGMEVGHVRYFLKEKEIGTIPIRTANSVERAGYGDSFRKAFHTFLL